MLTERKTKGTKKKKMTKYYKIYNKKEVACPPGDVTDETKQYEYNNINSIRQRAEGKDSKPEAQRKHIRGSRISLWYE